MRTIKQNVPLHTYTTLHVGGAAEYFTAVHSIDELREAVLYAKEHELPVTIIGGGSNVLIKDEGMQGLVIQNTIKGIHEEIHTDEIIIRAGAGEVFDEVVAYAVRAGYWGLENLSCIPGSVGATPIQNVGAYGVEVAELIGVVYAYDMINDLVTTFTTDQCAFGYRDSFFKTTEGRRYVVTEVAFRLTRTPSPRLLYRDLAERFGNISAPSLLEIRTAVCEIRAQKFPDWTKVGTAGSFFKNPIISEAQYADLKVQYSDLPGFPTHTGMVKIPLGWVLDKVCGVRGIREGHVGTYEGQALVLIAHSGATATEVETFAKKIAAVVFEKTRIVIEWEVTKM